MTIKEFADLCDCNPQTLRYYDQVGLLKPVKVDAWTKYRYYAEDQALQFVKIKNLQLAGFSIQEIKGFLQADDHTICLALADKIKEQELRLEQTRTIQQSYLNDIQTMKDKVKAFRNEVLALMEAYDPTEEFGINAQEYRTIIEGVSQNIEECDLTRENFFYDLPGEEGKAQEEELFLKVLDNPDYKLVKDQHGWIHAKEVLDPLHLPDDGKTYMLVFAIGPDKDNQTAFANTVLTLVMQRNQKTRPQSVKAGASLNCNVTTSEDGQNHFWLLQAGQ
ncbi:MAG: MerR family transcriptional regulator [Eubacteriales bacterium]|nr:MerR family transcriptional regulator [Clostridiales bacterium]MDY5836897.1 MerR family transcriptional regulator [Eubacteriales bacterium]